MKINTIIPALRKLIVFLAVSVALQSCDFNKPDMIQNNNSLNGKIYQPAQNRFVDTEAFFKQLQSSDTVLVGETHDNPEHHQRQIDIIKRYLAKGETGLVALEMVTDTQMESILKDQPNDADSLIKVLTRETNGWEYEKYYKDVFQSLYDSGYMMTAANLNRNIMIGIVTQGDSAIPENIRAIVSHVSLDEEKTTSLQKEIESSHCGMLLGQHAAGMIMGQRVRDAYMAKALVDAKTKADKVLLLAGSGHVRSDRGVPLYVNFLTPQPKMLSIALVELVADHDDPKDYANRWGAKELPFDYVWFTDAVQRPDPCEELRQHMKKMPHAKPLKQVEAEPKKSLDMKN